MSSSGRDARDDAFVAVATGDLVADGKLALGRNEHLDHLEHAGRQLVAARQSVDELGLFALEGVDAVEVGLDSGLVASSRGSPSSNWWSTAVRICSRTSLHR